MHLFASRNSSRLLYWWPELVPRRPIHEHFEAGPEDFQLDEAATKGPLVKASDASFLSSLSERDSRYMGGGGERERRGGRRELKNDGGD